MAPRKYNPHRIYGSTTTTAATGYVTTAPSSYTYTIDDSVEFKMKEKLAEAKAKYDTDYEVARIKAEGPRNIADLVQDVLVSKKNPTISDVLDFNMNIEPKIDRTIFEAGTNPRIIDGDSSWGSTTTPDEIDF